MDDAAFVAEIWDDLAQRVGADLRVVTRYHATDFETKMREDVRQRYTEREDQHVVSSTIVNQLSHSEMQDTFKVGNLEGLLRIFEEACVLSWADPINEKSGIIVSVERDADLADVEWVIEYLNEEIESRLT